MKKNWKWGSMAKPSFIRLFELQVEVKLMTWGFSFYCKREPKVNHRREGCRTPEFEFLGYFAPSNLEFC